MFKTQFYIDNRRQLVGKYQEGVIVIAGNSLLQRSADTNFTFRQDSNILYLTGLNEPDIVLIIDVKTKEEFLYVPQREGISAIFNGQIDAQEITKVSGIKNIVSDFSWINRYVKNKIVIFNIEKNKKSEQLYINPYKSEIYKKIARHAKEVVNVSTELANLRMIKKHEELQAIAYAVQKTKIALREVENVLASLSSEKDCETLINTYFAKQDLAHAYEPIVASGKNATTLHYVKNNSKLINNSGVLFDVGAEYYGYAADISRTFIKGENKRVLDIIQAVTDVQKDTINYIKPSITWKQLSEFANDRTLEELKKLKITKRSDDIQKYFPHAIGHFLGLDVHDVGDYSQPLAENMVITIEPGIYIPEEDIGVRIEDDIVITKTGAKVL